MTHGVPVKVKNLAGWSPLAEAISYGDRQTSKYFKKKCKAKSLKTTVLFLFVSSVLALVKKLKQQAREQMEERRPNLVAALRKMGDFYMELKWDFQSWGKYKFFLFFMNFSRHINKCNC